VGHPPCLRDGERGEIELMGALLFDVVNAPIDDA
jgi:hypothetical protein